MWVKSVFCSYFSSCWTPGILLCLQITSGYSFIFFWSFWFVFYIGIIYVISDAISMMWSKFFGTNTSDFVTSSIYNCSFISNIYSFWFQFILVVLLFVMPSQWCRLILSFYFVRCWWFSEKIANPHEQVWRLQSQRETGEWSTSHVIWISGLCFWKWFWLLMHVNRTEEQNKISPVLYVFRNRITCNPALSGWRARVALYYGPYLVTCLALDHF